MKLRTTVLAALIACASTAVNALPPLSENARVKGEFLAAAVGDEIRKNCPTISARLFRVLGRASKLEDYALSQGYSKADIKAMREDPTAKAKLKGMRDAYLDSHGVTKGDSDSYCRLGLEEIEKKTLTGWLLRAN